MELLSFGRPNLARAHLEAIRFSPVLPPEAVSAAFDLIERTACTDPAGDRVSGQGRPGGFLQHDTGTRARPYPLRSLQTAMKRLRAWPPELMLPPLQGNGNDFGFLLGQLGHPALSGPLPPLRLGIVCWLQDSAQIDALHRALAASRPDSQGRLPATEVTFFAPPDLDLQALAASLALGLAPVLSPGLRPRWQAGNPWQQPPTRQADWASAVDVLLFIPPEALADPWLGERVLRLAALSDNLCQVLTWMPDDPEHPAAPADRLLWSRAVLDEWARDPAAFRRLEGFAFATGAERFRQLGGFEPRFASIGPACHDLAVRLHAGGAYFLPLAARVSGPPPPPPPPPPASDDQALLISRCPHPMDRRGPPHSGLGGFEIPKVSVYIPAYNAARYLPEAIDSVLDQDFTDLEICIADDGSSDRTLEILQTRYEQEPRVRWSTGPNGGIGHASNRAIRMARGLYIGQLDSDDRLKPGAVQRLVEVLDANPQIGCAYGSCERIGPQGNVLAREYSWPEFSRQKMMLTSIAHHFRMFRRQTWSRTSGFREDIVNAVDYDMFLKMAEIAEFRHIDEILYQRRWHGENTSLVNVGSQTRNTYRVQQESLRRQGLDRHWKVQLLDPSMPRQITYRRQGAGQRALFWPDYSRSNPYQRLLYARAKAHGEILGGDIDCALRVIRDLRPGDPQGVTFHLHWLNKLLGESTTLGQALDQATAFLGKLRTFRAAGGRLVWTIHNSVSHDLPFPQVERRLAAEIAALADAIHVHDAHSLPDIERHFPVPVEKVYVHRHGHYLGVYPDFCTRAQARTQLGLDPQAEVVLFLGQIRPYKGLDALLDAFAAIAPQRNRLQLLLAGRGDAGLLASQLPPALRSRLHVVDRFIEDLDLQLFFRAADFAVFPYRDILTSGSLLLSLSFGLPAILPEGGMARSLLGDGECGMLYPRAQGAAGLTRVMRQMLDLLDAGEGPAMAAAASRRAEAETWDDIGPMLFGEAM